MNKTERVNVLTSLTKLCSLVKEEKDNSLFRWQCTFGEKKYLWFTHDGELYARTEDLHDTSIENLDKHLLHFLNFSEKQKKEKSDD